MIYKFPGKIKGLTVVYSQGNNRKRAFDWWQTDPGKIVIKTKGQVVLTEERASELGMWLSKQHGWRTTPINRKK